jgi:hypothetical protein
MTQSEKHGFVVDLMDSVTETICARIPDMPEEWDGHELRAYIVEQVTQRVPMGTGLSGTRLKEYKNTILISNL